MTDFIGTPTWDTHLADTLTIIAAHCAAGGGRPTSATTTRFAADGGKTVKLIDTDFTGLIFSLNNTITGGTIGVKVRNAGGLPRSETSVSMNRDGFPKIARTKHYRSDGNSVDRLVDTDYTELKFDNFGRLAGGVLKTKTFTPDGILDTEAEEFFNQLGMPETITGRRYDQKGHTVISRSLTDYSQAVLTEDRQIASGIVIVSIERGDRTLRSMTITRIAVDRSSNDAMTRHYEKDGTTIRKISTVCRREDNTLMKMTSILARDGKPFSATINIYGQDGLTVLREEMVVYSGDVSFDEDGVPVGGMAESKVRSYGHIRLEASQTVFANDLSSERVTRVYGMDGKKVAAVIIENFRADKSLARMRKIDISNGNRPTNLTDLFLDSDGITVTSRSQTNFANIQFGDGGQIAGGSLNSTIFRTDGTRKNSTQTLFGNTTV
jgi:hypothetical protein